MSAAGFQHLIIIVGGIIAQIFVRDRDDRPSDASSPRQ